MCDHINGVLVASGVDEQGEWQSLECEDCGKTWVERRNTMPRKNFVNGYAILNEPTREEFDIYWNVKRFLMEEWIAEWLEGEERLTDGEFIALCEDFEDADFGEEESETLRYLFELIIKRRNDEVDEDYCWPLDEDWGER